MQTSVSVDASAFFVSKNVWKQISWCCIKGNSDIWELAQAALLESKNQMSKRMHDGNLVGACMKNVFPQMHQQRIYNNYIVTFIKRKSREVGSQS